MESRGLAPSCGPIGETEERVELAESPLVNILFQVFLQSSGACSALVALAPRPNDFFARVITWKWTKFRF